MVDDLKKKQHALRQDAQIMKGMFLHRWRIEGYTLDQPLWVILDGPTTIMFPMVSKEEEGKKEQ
jgi:hypothetical protein